MPGRATICAMPRTSASWKGTGWRSRPPTARRSSISTARPKPSAPRQKYLARWCVSTRTSAARLPRGLCSFATAAWPRRHGVFCRARSFATTAVSRSKTGPRSSMSCSCTSFRPRSMRCAAPQRSPTTPTRRSARRCARGDGNTRSWRRSRALCARGGGGGGGEPQRRAFAVFREAVEAGIAAVRPGATAADVAHAENDVFRRHGLGDYTTSQWTRARGQSVGLFCDGKPHLLEDVTTPLAPRTTLIVHPNTYHPEAGYIVLGDAVVVTDTGAEVLTKTPRELFEV